MLKNLQNESQTDRIVRIIAGLILGAFSYFALTGILQMALYLIAVILVVTGLTGFCLIYKLLGIKTKK